ncbi:MAG: flagellar basal body-associated protein FliL [Pseudomonadota bacterium]
MAKAEEAAPEAPKGKSKKLLIIILAVVLLVVLAGGGAAVYLLTSKPAAEQVEGEEGEDEEAHAEEEEHPPVYEKLDAFTVNLADGETYLQVEINLKLADAKLSEKLKARMPEVKDAVLRLLSSQSPEELATVEGKDKLAGEVQKSVNEVLGVKKASKGVEKVLFPAFIIQ